MAKNCLQTVIFHSSIEDAITPVRAITNMTVISDQNIVLATAEYIDNELSMEPSFDVWACREQVHCVAEEVVSWCCVLFFEGWKVGAPNLRPEIHRPGQ